MFYRLTLQTGFFIFLISIGTHSTLLVFKPTVMSHCVVDRHYLKVLSPANCTLVYVYIGTSNNSAGYWGEPHCDMPMQTLVNLMEHLNDTSDQFEWIYLTGDLPAHNIWDQTKSGQVFILKKTISLFDEYLPNKPLFYAIGNHESDPCNW